MIARARRWAADVVAALVELGRALVRAGEPPATQEVAPIDEVSPAPAAAALAGLAPAPAPRPPPEMLSIARTGDRASEVTAALVEQLEHRRVELDDVLWPIAALGRVPDPWWPPLRREGRPS